MIENIETILSVEHIIEDKSDFHYEHTKKDQIEVCLLSSRLLSGLFGMLSSLKIPLIYKDMEVEKSRFLFLMYVIIFKHFEINGVVCV